MPRLRYWKCYFCGAEFGGQHSGEPIRDYEGHVYCCEECLEEEARSEWQSEENKRERDDWLMSAWG